MAYGTANVDTIQSSTAGTPVQFNDGNGTQVGTLCRAWVNFTGSTGAIKSSFNVSSVTRNGTGDYTVNFTNAMVDTKYAVAGSMDTYSSGANGYRPNTWNTGSLQMYTAVPGTGVIDASNVSVAVFR
jgi:hypothetical protein